MVEIHDVNPNESIQPTRQLTFKSGESTALAHRPGSASDRFVTAYEVSGEQPQFRLHMVKAIRSVDAPPLDNASLMTAYTTYKAQEKQFLGLPEAQQQQIINSQKAIEQHLLDQQWDGVDVDPSAAALDSMKDAWNLAREYQEYFKQLRLTVKLQYLLNDVTDI